MLSNNQTILNTSHHASELLKHLQANKHVIPVFDLDGVLLDASHRITLNPDGSLDLDKYRQDTTAANVMMDKNLPLMAVIHALNEVGRDYHVATARVLCTHSQRLLKSRCIFPNKIISRGENDTRKDWLLKITGIQAEFSQRYFKDILLIDDCPDNCDAFINALGAWAVNVDINNSPRTWLQQLL